MALIERSDVLIVSSPASSGAVGDMWSEMGDGPNVCYLGGDRWFAIDILGWEEADFSVWLMTTAWLLDTSGGQITVIDTWEDTGFLNDWNAPTASSLIDGSYFPGIAIDVKKCNNYIAVTTQFTDNDYPASSSYETLGVQIFQVNGDTISSGTKNYGDYHDLNPYQETTAIDEENDRILILSTPWTHGTDQTEGVLLQINSDLSTTLINQFEVPYGGEDNNGHGGIVHVSGDIWVYNVFLTLTQNPSTFEQRMYVFNAVTETAIDSYVEEISSGGGGVDIYFTQSHLANTMRLEGSTLQFFNVWEPTDEHQVQTFTVTTSSIDHVSDVRYSDFLFPSDRLQVAYHQITRGPDATYLFRRLSQGQFAVIGTDGTIVSTFADGDTLDVDDLGPAPAEFDGSVLLFADTDYPNSIALYVLPVEEEPPTETIDVRKWTWNIKAITLNYDGGLTSNMQLSKAYPYMTTIEVPVEPAVKIIWSTDWGNDMIVRLDYDDGSHIETLSPPSGHFDVGSGLEFDGTYLWYSDTDEDGDAILKLDPSDLSVVSTIPAPGLYGHNDLAWDGTNLWTGGYLVLFGTSEIFKLDPSDGSVLDSFEAPDDDQTNGLAYDGQYLYWAGSRNNQDIYKLDPSDGSTVEILDSMFFGTIGGMFYDADDGNLLIGGGASGSDTGVLHRVSTAGVLIETLTPDINNYSPYGVVVISG